MCNSIFGGVSTGVPVEIYALAEKFREDTCEKKVDLGVGIYRTENGKSWVLPVVREAEKILAMHETADKSYLSTFGNEDFCKLATEMLLGANSSAILENRVFSMQTISTVGALRIGAEFLKTHLGLTTFYCSDPTWEGHDLTFINSGFTNSVRYRYWCQENLNLDFGGLIGDLENAPEKSVIILHPCAHNPTGCDPSKDQWKAIADVVKAKHLVPFFDFAYQGLATGDLDEDAWVVRYFVGKGIELLCAQTFSKNFGLCSERVANLAFVTNDPTCLTNIRSQLSIIVRSLYSTPPSHGSRVISLILKTPNLREKWKRDLCTMASNITRMRRTLKEELDKINTPGSWDHIASQIGMFCYTGLTCEQSERMINEHHIYMLRSGRINISGLNRSNVEYVAKAIRETVSQTDYTK